MSQMRGEQSILFKNPPYVIAWASVAGKKEGEGPLKEKFDKIETDDYANQDTWEAAESQLMKESVGLVIKKGNVRKEDIRYIFAGDLLGQTIATTFGVMEYKIPLFGLYGACSTAGESLALAAMTVAAGYAEHAIAATSSHFASAERQFRYPLEYAGQRPLSSTWTVTGSGAFMVSSQKSNIKIAGITTGRVVDYGVKDSMNMGAAMAPAAADLIERALKDFEYKPQDFDLIATGDLGKIGRELLLDLLDKKGIHIGQEHKDCGMMIFDLQNQEVGSGGSGCGCSAVTLAAEILPKLEIGALKRVLFVPTGALLSTVSFNEGNSIPGIAHGIIFEHAR